MRFRPLLLMLLIGCAPAGCASLKFWEDADAERLAAAGVELEMSGEVPARDGFSQEIPVVIAADRKSATIEIDGGTQRLLWTGETESCPCRSYVSENYALRVRFPGSASDGEAQIERLTEGNEPMTIAGLIEEDDGLEIRVTLIVADDRRSVSFHDQGEAEVLTWDGTEVKGCNCRSYVSSTFQATVFFPEGNRDGKATLKRKASAP